jgi:hypothetical protein
MKKKGLGVPHLKYLSEAANQHDIVHGFASNRDHISEFQFPSGQSPTFAHCLETYYVM